MGEQVMRHCRKMVSELSEKLTAWGDDWDLPNMYMKLLFIVSLGVLRGFQRVCDGPA
jgi:hypothetical protein